MDTFILICAGFALASLTAMLVSAAVVLAVVCGTAVKDIIKKGL